MSTFIEAAMALHILGSIALLLATSRFMRRAIRRDTPFTPTPSTRAIAMMIPVGAVTPHTEPALRSLLEQEHPGYRVMLVTATEDEEAAALIKRLCDEYGHASHVVAGVAQRCAQKNHNHLAAIAELKPNEDILVFCDSTHLAKPDFLARLVDPIVRGEAMLSSGYRFIRPGDDRPGTLVQMLAVQTLHILWSIRPITQPWGGAMAIDRATFFDNRIPDLWSRTSVDDYSMGPYFQSLGIHSTPVAEACLETHLSGQTVCGAANWFYRQLQFFKFHTPGTWVAVSIIPVIYLLMLGYALATLPWSLWYLGGVALMSLWYTRVIPNNAPAPKRVSAYFLFTVMAAIQLLRTWTSNILKWQDTTYRVKLGGEIAEIIRRDS